MRGCCNKSQDKQSLQLETLQMKAPKWTVDVSVKTETSCYQIAAVQVDRQRRWKRLIDLQF